MKNYLTAIQPYLPPALISPAAFEQIVSVADCFPGNFASTIVLETRLKAAAEPVDLSLLITDPQALLALQSSEPLQHDPVWQQIFTFADCWKALLAAQLGHVWLEFDGQHMTPGVYAGPSILEHKRPPLLLNWQPAWIADHLLPALTGVAVSPAIDQHLERCISALPPAAQVFEVGRMFSRQSSAIRLCLMGIPSAEIVNYLRQIGWTGALDKVQALLQKTAPLIDAFHVYLDLDETIEANLGLECVLDAPLGKQKAAWQPLLDALVDASLCTAEKREALLNFPRYREDSIQGKWFYLLSHIKLVVQPDQPFQAKAYLACVHQP